VFVALIKTFYCLVVFFSTAVGLPPNWEKRLDSKTGKYYYINHLTKTTQWNVPGVGQCANTFVTLELLSFNAEFWSHYS
jgi:hypothetical protein